MPGSSLERHLCATEKGVPLTGQGRKLFEQCIVVLASLGFGIQVKDVAQPVEPYVQHNDHEKGKKVLKCKGRPGYPGPSWLDSFMDKNNLSLKEATKLSCAQYNGKEPICNI